MQAKLTKRTVDSLGPSERDLFVWDTALKGFGLKVTPAGGKVYIVQYRMGGRGTATKRYTIGRHGSPWTAEGARTEAERLLKLVDEGKDPAEEAKARAVRGLVVADLCDRYLKQHVQEKNAATTVREFTRLIEKHIKPRLGRLEVAKVGTAEVSDLHFAMRKTPRSANQTLAVLSKMFNLAELWGLRPKRSNPCEGIERYPENQRERFLSDAEVTALGMAFTECAGRERDTSINAIALLVLTGLRLNDVLTLRWDDVDLDGGALVIRKAKGRRGTVTSRRHPIGAVTIAFLAAMDRAGEWVLPALDPEEHLPSSTLEHAWARIRQVATVMYWRQSEGAAAQVVDELTEQFGRRPTHDECTAFASERKMALPCGMVDVRLHDLRHTHGTFAGSTGANAFLVRDKLGHKTLAMTGRYVNKDVDPLRDLSDKVEGRINAALRVGAGDGDQGGTVVPLPRSGGRRRRIVEGA